MNSNTDLLQILVIALIVGVMIWLITGSHGSRNNFGRSTSGRGGLGMVGGSEENTFLPIVMGNLGASSEQLSAATKMIRSYSQVCGKVSAAAEIQKILNTHGPSGNWTGLISQLNGDLYAVKQSTNNCQGTTSPGCDTASDCAYADLDPTLYHGLPPGAVPGWDCVSSKCQIYRSVI